MNRSFSVMILIAILTMMAAGCAPTGASQPTSAPPESPVQHAPTETTEPAYEVEIVEITYWNPYEGWGQYQEIVKPFQESCEQQLKIQVSHSGGNKDSLQAMINAGTAPDVMLLSTVDTLEYTSQGQLLDLTDKIQDRYDYLPGAMWQNLSMIEDSDECDYDKSGMHVYGEPQSASFLVLLYNKRVFEKAGLKPDIPPTTMDELAAFAKQIAESGTEYGFMLTGGGYFTLPFLYAFGGGLYDPFQKRVLVNDPATIAALDFAESLRQNPGGIAPEFFDPTSQYQKAVQAFKAGQIGMIFNGPWAIPDILSSDEFKDHGNLGVAMIPSGPGGQGSPVDGLNFVVSAQSKYPDQAIQWIHCVNNAEYQAKLANELYMLPTRASTFEILPQDQSLLGQLAQVSRKQMDFTPKDSLFVNIPFILDDFTAASNNIFQGYPSSQEMESLFSKWEAKPPDLAICCRCRWNICC